MSFKSSDKSKNFSLVLGGPLYQLWRKIHLVRPPMDWLMRRIIVIPLIAWLPLIPLSIISNVLTKGRVPFLFDWGTHVRFLLALPMLIVAELIVHQHLQTIVEEFVDRDLILPKERSRFEK